MDDWIARTGAQWRRLPDEYGKWNSVFRRYRRWTTTGVFDAMLEAPAEAVERDAGAGMIDSTFVRAHHCAAGTKKKLCRPRRSAGRAAGFPNFGLPRNALAQAGPWVGETIDVDAIWLKDALSAAIVQIDW